MVNLGILYIQIYIQICSILYMRALIEGIRPYALYHSGEVGGKKRVLRWMAPSISGWGRSPRKEAFTCPGMSMS